MQNAEINRDGTPPFPFCILTSAFCIFLLTSLPARANPIDNNVKQLVVSIAPDWNASQGRMQLFERTPTGWKPASTAFPVLYGKNGLAWGRGVKGTGEPGLHKVERDGRAPAGVFEIGKIYGYDAKLPEGANYPYHQVTEADCWVDDPKSPHYNQHVVIDPNHPPDWSSHERMRPGDFAYQWLIDIRHNAAPPVPGAGSAIFFHTRRGVSRPTSGCTTMAREDLLTLIKWLRADKHPLYALLPWSEYRAKSKAWGLPDVETVRALAHAE